MKIKIIAFLFCLVAFSSASAKMPFYDDDAEFDRCTKMTGDWNRCMSEETRRALNDVKVLYREVLANPKLSDWNSNFDESKQIMRDMYSSWTAFYNRLCSLSKVSAQYTGGWKDEELSCKLYYVKHHKDHLNCINNMLLSKASAKDNFIVAEHDEEYKRCLSDNSTDNCLLSEFQRSSEKIKELYKKLYDSRNTSGWNNGPDLKSGNYRDMFESWVAYRNRLCSLSAQAYKNYPERPDVSKNHCLQYLNREKLEALENLYALSMRAVSPEKSQKKSEDGGKAEGQAIVPLEKRIETTESLTGENIQSENEDNSAKSDDNSSNLPAWARRR